MAVDPVTSTDKLRVAQFQEKLTILNREFIKQMQVWVKQCPYYDLSASVNSYLAHVKTLDETYRQKGAGGDKKSPAKSPTKSPSKTSAPPGRPIAKAKRRSDSANNSRLGGGLNDSTIMNQSSFDKDLLRSTPSSKAAPTMNINDVSAIVSSAPTPAAAPAPSAAGGGRKRAIRGGGLLGDPESVVFRGADTAAVSSTVSESKMPPVTVQLPKATAGFWSTGGKKDEEKKEEDKGEEKKSVFPSLSGSTPVFAFGKTASASPAFPSFGKTEEKKKEDEKKEDEKKEEGGETKKDAPAIPTFSFGSTASSATGGLSFPSFASSTSTTTPAPAFGGFGFGAAKPAGDAAPAATAGGDEEEGEYVPPKAEVVESAEPDAVHSVKCAVHKMVDKAYSKLGVGMLHVKDKDGKMSLLVRAATATGTVWLNALINATMKATSVDATKMRVSCATGPGEISTFLVRFSAAADLDKVKKYVDDNSK